MRIKIFCTVLLGLILSMQAFADTNQPLKLVGGEMSSVQQYMEPGKWTVVMIWSNNCHICDLEAGKYSAFHTAHAHKDAKIIGLSLDGSDQIAQKFVSRHDLNYPNLVGSQHEVASFYLSESGRAFRGTPSFMVYDTKGELITVQAGGIPPEIIEQFIAENS